MLQIIENYIKVKKAIPELIDLSGFRNDFIAKKMGMKSANFSIKKQRSSWSDVEVNELLEIITKPSEDVEDYLLLLDMRAKKDEETLTLQEFKEQMGWK